MDINSNNLIENDKSLSLGMVESEHILEDFFSNRETKFNESELDRLVN